MGLSQTSMLQGDLHRATVMAQAGVDLHRRLKTDKLPVALSVLADVEAELSHLDEARTLYEEALPLARNAGDAPALQTLLNNLSLLELNQGRHQRALNLLEEARDIAASIGNPFSHVLAEYNIACTLREMGRPQEARTLMTALIPRALELNHVSFMLFLSEDYAAILAELGDHTQAVRLLGAADAARDRLSIPRGPSHDAEIAEPIAKARAALTPDEWNTTYNVGQGMTVENAVADALSEQPPT